ncbi:MAG: DUF302 domain-containing protein [bacterium]
MFYYTKTTSKSFDEIVTELEKNIAEHGLRILHTHNVQQTFAEKGFEFIPYKIIEVCNVKFAKQALDADRLIGLMMPCPIVIWHEKGITTISTMLPTAMIEFFPDKGLNNFAEELEAILRNIIDKSVA